MTSDFIVIRDSTPSSAIPKGIVVAMGNFDGVHLGHRAVIEAALAMGRAHGKPALALSFEPHPRRIRAAFSAPIPPSSGSPTRPENCGYWPERGSRAPW